MSDKDLLLSSQEYKKNIFFAGHTIFYRMTNYKYDCSLLLISSDIGRTKGWDASEERHMPGPRPHTLSL
jgi:hypothetical protein